MKPILLSIQRRLRTILLITNNSKRDDELRALAQNLGCSLGSIYELQTAKLLEEELVRRIQEAAREERDAKLWWFALLSSIASILSALVALFVVYKQ